MSPEELLGQLVELADDAGLRVRPIRGGAGGDGEPPAASGTCSVRGELWVILSGVDPVDEQIDVLARALRTHRAAFLESRYLPPALRERLRPGEPEGGGATSEEAPTRGPEGTRPRG